MFPPTTYTATCWRDGAAWTVHLPELGRTASAARLGQVEGVARGLVASATGEDPTSCRVVVELVARHGLTELIEAASAAREDPDRVSVEAVTLRRGLARRLAGEGLDVRDVAALLGLSYGRALSLVADVPSPRSAAPLLEVTGPAVPHQGLPDQGGPVRRPGGHSGYRHEVLLYRGPRGFLDGTLAFVQDAVARAQPVMVAVVPERLALLRAAVGAGADRVHWVDMAQLGANPARILPAWQRFVDEHAAGGQPVRGVGEPVWAGRTDAELAECQLHEALLDLALPPSTPLWLRCPYDVEALPDDVLREALHSHAGVLDGEVHSVSPDYAGSAHGAALFARPLPEPAGAEQMPFDLGTLDLVRLMVLSRAAEVGLGSARSGDLALAVHEAASDSLEHGGGRAVLRVWHEQAGLVCEVRDGGHLPDPLGGRRAPGPDGERGHGLWMVHQLGDLVQVRSSASGTSVRVLARV